MFAKTMDEVKQDLIDHLAGMDKAKLNMMDLNTYAIIVKLVDDMMKPDPSEAIFDRTMRMISSGKNWCYTTDEIEKMKVGDMDG